MTSHATHFVTYESSDPELRDAVTRLPSPAQKPSLASPARGGACGRFCTESSNLGALGGCGGPAVVLSHILRCQRSARPSLRARWTAQDTDPCRHRQRFGYAATQTRIAPTGCSTWENADPSRKGAFPPVAVGRSGTRTNHLQTVVVALRTRSPHGVCPEGTPPLLPAPPA